MIIISHLIYQEMKIYLLTLEDRCHLNRLSMMINLIQLLMLLIAMDRLLRKSEHLLMNMLIWNNQILVTDNRNSTKNK
jgi:hypothetical protein